MAIGNEVLKTTLKNIIFDKDCMFKIDIILYAYRTRFMLFQNGFIKARRIRMCTKYPRLISILVESVFPNVMRTRWMSELEFNEKSENDRVESK